MSLISEIDKIYADAQERLVAAQKAYARAETELIEAERAVKAARVGTWYYKKLREMR